MGRRLLLASLVGSPLLFAQDGRKAADTATGFLSETIQVGGKEHRYVLYVPPGYSSARPWPLVVFLHGAGECGTDGQKQISVGLGPAITNDVGAWPFLVLFPQKPDRASAWEDHEAVVMEMVWRVRSRRTVDDRQLFLTGLSQGGHGTWALGARHSTLWAALAPICGYGDAQEIAPVLKDVPIWCFHGEDDRTVPVQQSKDLCAAVTAAGGRPMLTVFPRTGHDSWTRAYRETRLPLWLRLVAIDRVGAAYLADPAAAKRVTIAVRQKAPGGAGTIVTARVEASRGGAGWSFATGKAGGAPDESRGTWERQPGLRLARRRLVALQDAAVFLLPAPVQQAPVPGKVIEPDEFTIDVVLDGEAGLWQFHREIPSLTEHDAAHARAVGAIAEFVRSVAALR
ncbi:MAG: hypothetical protein FJ265_07835 [Planctomycetes bacterium]|nr:hypothetical protein [Planctomycetota bacterium]